MFYLFLYVIFLSHFLACGWHIIGKYGKENNYKNWIENNKDIAINDDLITRYLISIYFIIISLSTIGYGDITPKNNAEYIFTTTMAILTTALMGYVIN